MSKVFIENNCLGEYVHMHVRKNTLKELLNIPHPSEYERLKIQQLIESNTNDYSDESESPERLFDYHYDNLDNNLVV